MSGTTRSAILAALGSATQLPVPLDLLEECLTSNPDLIERSDAVAASESVIKTALLTEGGTIPPGAMAAARPVLGNIAEAVIESMLATYGWQPVYQDVAGYSFGHGVDLIMLDPALERLVAIEVKSTIQPHRWPRLPRGHQQQLQPIWYNDPANEGMSEWNLQDTDTFTMISQLHFQRRTWRSCLTGGTSAPRAVTESQQLTDLSWLG